MKLRKVRLQSLRNHTDSTLDIGDASFVVIRGNNFSGKSSIAQAISLLCTPSTDGLDAQGRGFVTKIKRGETKAVIAGEIQGKAHTVSRTVTLNTNTSGRTDKSECVDDPSWHTGPFEKMLEANRTALSVCLNTSTFLLMEEKQQKSLLAQLALPSHHDFPADKMEAVEKALGQGAIDFTGEPFAVIEAAYKKLYKERELVNRQVKEFVVPDKLSDSFTDATQLQSDLHALQAESKIVLADRDAAVAKANKAEVQRAKLSAEITALLENVETGKKRIKELEPKILTLEKLREMMELSARKKDLDDVSKLSFEADARITERTKDVARYKSLPADQANCLSCGQPVSKEYVAIALKEAEESLKLALGAKEQITVAVKDLGGVEPAMQTIKEHEAALGEKARIETSLNETVAKGKAKRQELASLGDAQDAKQAFVKPLADLDAKINSLNEQLRPAIAFEERAKEIAVKTEQLKKLETKAASVDSLVQYFGKDGVKAKLLEDHISGFENKINEVMRSFGYKCSLSIEPYQFEVTDARGVTTPVRELSGSEQLLFSVALQCAVSRAAGIGIVVADRLDTFLPAQRQKANKSLYTATQDGTLDQVFLIMSDESRDVPKLPNAAFFMVQDGAVQRL